MRCLLSGTADAERLVLPLPDFVTDFEVLLVDDGFDGIRLILDTAGARLLAPPDVLSFPLLALPKWLFGPLDLMLYAEPEVLAPLEEADLSDEALPGRRPAAERPTDTS